MITKGVSFGGFVHKGKRIIKNLLFSKGFGWSGGVFLPSSNEIPLQEFKETVVLNGHDGISSSMKKFLIENNKNYDVGAFNNGICLTNGFSQKQYIVEKTQGNDAPQFKSGLNKVSYQFDGSNVVYL